MQSQRYVVASALLFMASLCVFVGVSHVSAITETTTSRAVEMKRIRVTNTDLNNAATSTDPGGVCNDKAKRLVLYTVPAAGQVNSIVTKVRTAFAQTGLQQIGTIAVRAEQGGVQISTDDIGVPHTDLTDTAYLENRKPNVAEYAFYDEDSSWNVVGYFCGKDALNEPVIMNSLSTGTVDFYIMVTRS